jgi:hypothetical protein
MKLGKAKQVVEYGNRDVYTGFFEGTVVAINPTLAELAELQGYTPKEDAKELVYEGTTKEKKEDYVQLTFWINPKSDELPLFKKSFMLIDKERVSEKGKTQYINQSGMSTWAMDERDMPEWFTSFTDKDKNVLGKREYREAIQGEADLYEFLTKFLGKVNYSRQDEDGVFADIRVDKKAMFKNIDKYVRNELSQLVGSDYATNVVAHATVHTGTDKDNNVKYYQNILGVFPLTIKDGSRYVDTLSVVKQCETMNNWNTNPILKRYVDGLTGEYGTKDIFHLGMLKVYDPNEAGTVAPIQTTNEVLRHESSNTPAAANTVNEDMY